MLFNPEGHAIHIYARQLLAEFEKLLAEYVGTWLASFFPVEFTQDQILEQCKLGSPPSSDGSSSIRSRAASIASLTTLDTGVTSGCLPWAEDVDGQSKSTSAKQVKIVVDGDDCDQMISSRKRTLSRTISDDLSFLVDDYENDSRGGIDASSTVSLSSFSRKMRRGSMDSLSTAADLEDTFEILAEENMIEDYSGRASLGTLRASQSLMNNYLNYSFSARDFNNSLVTDKFSGPVLAQRALFSLVSDLSKAVNRMSDDLFVVKFVSCHDQQDGASHAHVETKPTEKVNDSKKRGRHPANLAQQHLKAEFSAECMEMLSHLSSDTSDPDPVIRSPLVDSRYTFLETCQFRHYQFDSLRRAKYSSLMMLFHLHNPYDRSCRPLCKYCGETICGIRWHCDQCANFDVCDPCKVARDSSPSSLGKPVKLVESHSDLEDAVSCGGCHVHPLTPYRVTFH